MAYLNPRSCLYSVTCIKWHALAHTFTSIHWKDSILLVVYLGHGLGACLSWSIHRLRTTAVRSVHLLQKASFQSNSMLESVSCFAYGSVFFQHFESIICYIVWNICFKPAAHITIFCCSNRQFLWKQPKFQQPTLNHKNLVVATSCRRVLLTSNGNRNCSPQ